MFITKPDTKWMEGNWAYTPDTPCEICGSKYSIGYGPADEPIMGLKYFTCKFHSKLQPGIVSLIRWLRSQNRMLTKAEFDVMRMNSYDRGALIPYMDNELLVEQINFTLSNCSTMSKPPCTYDEAIRLYAKAAANRLLDPASTKSVDDTR